MSASASSAVFRVQELCDHILGFFDATGCAEDLKACALVSRTLSYSAQAQLFCDIILRVRNPHAAAVRLCSSLALSPHLTSSIRRLNVRVDLSILTTLSTISFCQLNELTLDRLIENTDHNTTHRVALLERDLIGLPSMRKVELIGHFVDFVSLDVMFSSPTLAVTELSFRDVLVFGDTGKLSGSKGRIQRPAVKSLKLVRSPSIEKWFIHPTCPFDFTHLVDVEIRLSMTDNLRQVLSSSCSSIERLTRRAEDAGDLDFSCLSALTCVHLATNDDDDSLRRSAASLLQVTAAPSLTNLIFEITSSKTDSLNLPNNLGAVALNIPSLRRFEIRIRRRIIEDQHRYALFENDAREVKSSMPSLSTGLLYITHYKLEGGEEISSIAGDNI
ncbi:hypothetical protein C8J57DRAFT_341684 [Mycena rebaudengoi]|nr:hypothetical protein C8J57DRAFT_341684 [Mycena rebaudengoi]